MKNYSSMSQTIINFLSDNQDHTISEIREVCRIANTLPQPENNTLSNALHTLKKKEKIFSTGEKGTYHICKTLIDQKTKPAASNSQLPDKAIYLQIDFSKFTILEPQNTRYYEMRLTVTKNSEIRLNSALQKKINTKNIEILISNDCKNILLVANGNNSHIFTKAGTAKNAQFTEMLKKHRIPLPTSYIITYDSDKRIFQGTINITPQK